MSELRPIIGKHKEARKVAELRYFRTEQQVAAARAERRALPSLGHDTTSLLILPEAAAFLAYPRSRGREIHP
jgi:hypothetical protein